MNSNMKWMKTSLAAGLVLAAVLGGTTSAFAHGHGDDEGHGHGRGLALGHFKFQHEVKLNFSDMDSPNWNWAMQNIARLASRGVFQGYSDGTFQPRRNVSRLDAIVAAVRLLGLESEAKSSAEMNAHLNFRDANIVEKRYPQAVGYVDEAVKHGLFSADETMIHPEKPATRLWATILLVRALKLEDQAQAKMNTQLPFRDAREIPAGSVGYVAEALDQKLIFGEDNNMFKPNQPVTRAQFAALLDRVGMHLPGYSNDVIKGTVTAPVTGNLLSVTEDNGKTDQLAIDPNVYVFENGQRMQLSDIKPGDQVTIRTYNNVVVFVEITSNAQQNATFNGTIQSVTGNNVTITRDGSNQTYALASNALIYRDGQQVAVSSLQAGDQAFVRLNNNQIVLLQVTSTSQNETSFTGTVKTAVNNNELTITKDQADGGSDVTYALASNAVIWRGGQNVNASALVAGDRVFVEVVNNQIIFVQVTDSAPANTTLNGATVKTAVSNNQLTLTKDGVDYTYALSSNAVIIRGNTAVDASALQPGDEVNATVVNNQIVVVTVTTAVNQSPNFTGTIEALNASSGTVTITRDNQNLTYTVNGNTIIYRNGVRVNLSNLQVGDEVSAVLQSGTSNTLMLLQVTKPVENTNGQFTVDGQFQSLTVNSTGEIATITVTQNVYNGTQSEIYNVSPNVTINGDPSQLVQNRQVELKGQNQVVTQITIQ